MSEILEHLYLLRSRRRIAAYRRALRAVVRPGDVVLDAGCGTGILGFLALRAGAARMIGVDRHPVVLLARELAKRNGLADRATFVLGSLPDVDLPQRATLMVSDLIGHGGIDARAFRILGGTQRRHLAERARQVPSGGVYWITPVRAPRIHRRLVDWTGGFDGLDLGLVGRFAVHRGYQLFEPVRAVGPAVEIGRLSFARLDRGVFPIEWTAEVRVTSPGVVHGVRWDYGLELAPGVLMGSRSRVGRQPFFFPFDPAPAVRRGDRLRVTFVFSADHNWSWTMEQRRGGRVCARAMHAGALASFLPLEQAELVPSWRPHAPAELAEVCWRIARMDGTRTLADLAREWAAQDGLREEEALERLRRACLEFKIGGSP